MTDADHFAINAWMLENGFQWIQRVHQDGGLWTYFHEDVGMIQLTQAAAAFAFFQYLKGTQLGVKSAHPISFWDRWRRRKAPHLASGR